MFQTDGIRENLENIIEISDIKPLIMEKFLNFLYCDAISQSDISTKLLYVAHKYAVLDLEDFCVDVITKSITESNLMDIMKMAYLLHKKDLLLTAYARIIDPKVLLAINAEWVKFTAEYPGVVKELQSFLYEWPRIYFTWMNKFNNFMDIKGNVFSHMIIAQIFALW